MFGLSFTEILVIAALVAVVWVTLGRRRRAREVGQPNAGEGAPEIEETVKCPVCGHYVPAHAPTACERDDCPYRG